jgi:hypothetical protein
MTLLSGIVKENEPKVVSVKMSTLIKAYEDGILKDYAKNRGTQEGEKLVVNVSPYKSMKTVGFAREGFGSLTIAKMSDKDYLMADGHSRFSAVRKIVEESESEHDVNHILDTSVTVTFINGNEHSTAYAIHGENKSQTGRQRILNTDYVPGNTIVRILKTNGRDLEPRLWQVFFHTVFACQQATKAGKIVDMEDVRRYTGSANNLTRQHISSSKWRLSHELYDVCESVIERYERVVMFLEGDKTLSDKEVLLKLVRQAGMFQYIALDVMSGKNITDVKPSELVRRISTNISDVRSLASKIARRNEAIGAVPELDALLKPRTRTRI